MKTLSFKKQLMFGYGVLLILVLWTMASLVVQNEIIFPTPWKTFIDLGYLLVQKQTYLVLLATVGRLVLSIVGAFAVSLVLSSLSIKYPSFYTFLKPLMTLFKTVPVASIIIILLVLVGHESSPYYITGLVLIPLLYEAIYQGYASIDVNIIDEVRMQTAINSEVIRSVYLPMITPFVFTGLVQSLGLGLKVMVMSEFIAQPMLSIGRELLYQKQQFEMGFVFAWTILLVLLIVGFEALLARIKTALKKS